jgi:uroporphyrinogen-III synthase
MIPPYRLLLLRSASPTPNREANYRIQTVLESQGLWVYPLTLTQINLFEPLPPLPPRFLNTLRSSVLSPYWVFCTSQHGVQQFYNGLCQGLLPQPYQLAVVGQQTAQSAQQLGLNVSFQPSANTPSGAQAAGLQFCQQVQPAQRLQVLWPCSQQAFPTLKQVLEDNGSIAHAWPVYSTQPNPEVTQTQVVELLQRHAFQAALFTSSSSVTAWNTLGLPSQSPALWFSLGSQTSTTIQQVKGLPPEREAANTNTESLVSLAQQFKQLCS